MPTLDLPRPTTTVRSTLAEQYAPVLRAHAEIRAECMPLVDVDHARSRIRNGQVGYDALRVLRSCGDPMPRYARVLDDVLQREVRARFDHANINLDVSEFGDGGLMPTGEELARFICQQAQHALGELARVTRVSVSEDATLTAVYEPD